MEYIYRRILLQEFQEEFCDIYHTVGFIHNDQTAGTHHGADGDEGCRNRSGYQSALPGYIRRTDHRSVLLLNFFAIRMPPPISSDDLAQGSTHRDLYEAGVVDLTAQCKYLGSFDSSVPMEETIPDRLR